VSASRRCAIRTASPPGVPESHCPRGPCRRSRARSGCRSGGRRGARTPSPRRPRKALDANDFVLVRTSSLAHPVVACGGRRLVMSEAVMGPTEGNRAELGSGPNRLQGQAGGTAPPTALPKSCSSLRRAVVSLVWPAWSDERVSPHCLFTPGVSLRPSQPHHPWEGAPGPVAGVAAEGGSRRSLLRRRRACARCVVSGSGASRTPVPD
jgi:hypothetical protein